MSRQQLVPKVRYAVNYGGANGYLSVFGGMDNFAYPATYGGNYARCVLPAPVTFSRFVARVEPGSNGLTPPTVTITLQKNSVDTALSVTIPSGTTTAVIDATHVVSTTTFDDVVWRVTGSVQGFFGYVVLTCVQIDTGDDFLSVYGLTPFTGSIGLGAGRVGGAFDNGDFATYSALALSGTYSISALDGDAITLTLKTYSGAPGVGIWTGYLRLNGVLQDGSGGTVDTRCVLTGANTTAIATFELPIAIEDDVEVVVIRTGASAAFALAHVSAGLVFRASVSRAYMSCGGNNNTLFDAGTHYLWNGAEQQTPLEASVAAPISEAGLEVLGFYGEGSDAPGVGKSVDWTMRKSGVDTALTFTFTGATAPQTGLSTGSVSYLSSDTISIGYTCTGAPGMGQFHWGLALRSPDTEPPPEPEPDPEACVCCSPGALECEGEHAATSIASIAPSPTKTSAGSWSNTFTPTPMGTVQ